MKRNIIRIDEEKCNGCGNCVTGCPEGAIQLINGKAKLVSENYCDGLGACIGECPEGAISIEEREAAVYDEAAVMENIIKQGREVIAAHLAHLLEHGEIELYDEAIAILEEKGIDIPQQSSMEIKHEYHRNHSCPGSANRLLDKRRAIQSSFSQRQQSALGQWPVKLKLISPQSTMFTGEIDLLISADCAPYADANFHQDFLNGRIMMTFCPKLDPYIEEYRDKLLDIISNYNIKSITIARMEVPCCSGVTVLAKEALQKSGKKIPLEEKIINIA
ncbi:MAG TPA: 4Fe-4S binding protein [Spirochaetota bacterium]|nr:4Fe-4S binding protein [Spirochaetota bacterium]